MKRKKQDKISYLTDLGITISRPNNDITIKLKKEEIERIIEFMKDSASPIDLHITNQLVCSIT